MTQSEQQEAIRHHAELLLAMASAVTGVTVSRPTVVDVMSKGSADMPDAVLRNNDGTPGDAELGLARQALSPPWAMERVTSAIYSA